MTARQELIDMLRYRRPHGTPTEKRFIVNYLLPLPGARQDDFGNVIVQVGESKIMWSSHTDTVHKSDGFQKLCLTDNDFVFTDDPTSNCLGADCTTGVWLMVQMIKAGVPGLYVFHRDEESGGRGSSWIVKNTPELVTGIEACIAFDRKSINSVITFQSGGRCCSNEFADSLADIIDLGMKKDTGGTFTDSASYTDHIGECTNISVGYYAQHTSKEYQDLEFADELLNRLLDLDVDKLVFKRKAGEYESRWGNGQYYYGYGSYTDAMYYYGDNAEIRDIAREVRQNASHLAYALVAEGLTLENVQELIAKGKELATPASSKDNELFDEDKYWADQFAA